MSFEYLNDAADRHELLLVRGGMCHYFVRLDGWISVREIIVLPAQRRKGIGRDLLENMVRNVIADDLTRFAEVSGAIVSCPDELPANGFFAHMGFTLSCAKPAKYGRIINEWRIDRATLYAKWFPWAWAQWAQLATEGGAS